MDYDESILSILVSYIKNVLPALLKQSQFFLLIIWITPITSSFETMGMHRMFLVVKPVFLSTSLYGIGDNERERLTMAPILQCLKGQ